MGFFDFLRHRTRDPIRSRYIEDDGSRLARYAKYMRTYQGYAVRDSSANRLQWKRYRYNFARPIVNLSSTFFAGKPLTWKIQGDEELTKVASAIWDRSGSDRALLEAAVSGSIYGDGVVMATQDVDATGKLQSQIQFLDPAICFPTFDGADYSRLRSLEVCFETYPDDPNATDPVFMREFYTQTSMEVWQGDTSTGVTNYEALPAAWIRNVAVKGQPFGMSDLDGIIELVEEYDHLASKQTRIVDYYASPNMYFKGVDKGNVTKDSKTVFYLPAAGDVGFVEWKGEAPAVKEQLDNIRATIAEISQVPAVAFGHTETSTTNISGVALKILYGPLLSKTIQKRASWSPALEYVMWLAIKAETGREDILLADVNAVWSDPMPQDDAALRSGIIEEVNANLLSRQSAMSKLGVEDVDEEMKLIEGEQESAAANMAELAVRSFNRGDDPGRPVSKAVPGMPSGGAGDE